MQDEVRTSKGLHMNTASAVTCILKALHPFRTASCQEYSMITLKNHIARSRTERVSHRVPRYLPDTQKSVSFVLLNLQHFSTLKCITRFIIFLKLFYFTTLVQRRLGAYAFLKCFFYCEKFVSLNMTKGATSSRLRGCV